MERHKKTKEDKRRSEETSRDKNWRKRHKAT